MKLIKAYSSQEAASLSGAKYLVNVSVFQNTDIIFYPATGLDNNEVL